MKHVAIANLLNPWYQAQKRDLPWRKTKDPYKIWISEIILQQTRIDQGLPYYLRFVERFPRVSDLAKASIEDVLLIWQGLGYYSRARNMHFAANQVVDDYNETFPSSYSDLISLKGIGKYTAAAISSITSSEKRAVVDGNVIRLISRLLCIEEPVGQSKTLAQIEYYADLLIQNHDSGEMNQAMMEFGATVCVPRSPNCIECILNTECQAFKTDKQSEIPFKKGKTTVVDRFFNYLYISDSQSNFLIYQRPSNDIWHGMFELPLMEQKKITPKEMVTFLGFKPQTMRKDVSLKHLLSHRLIHATFWKINCTSEQLDLLAQSKNFIRTNPQNLKKYPISKLTDNFFLLISDTTV